MMMIETSKIGIAIPIKNIQPVAFILVVPNTVINQSEPVFKALAAKNLKALAPALPETLRTIEVIQPVIAGSRTEGNPTKFMQLVRNQVAMVEIIPATIPTVATAPPTTIGATLDHP